MEMLQILIYLVVVLVWGGRAWHWKDGQTEMLDGLDTTAVIWLAGSFLVDGFLSRFHFAKAFRWIAQRCKRYVVGRPAKGLSKFFATWSNFCLTLQACKTNTKRLTFRLATLFNVPSNTQYSNFINFRQAMVNFWPYDKTKTSNTLLFAYIHTRIRHTHECIATTICYRSCWTDCFTAVSRL